MDYTVTWEIDIFDVDSPEDAARKAREVQVNPNTWAVVFEVTSPDGTTVRVDLADSETR